MIDLHSHTTASDGTYTPSQLLAAARKAGLEALAITDHDTFAGYDEVREVAAGAGFDLLCGIELSTRLPRTSERRGRSVHLLGYFPGEAPSGKFRDWLRQIQDARRERNGRLIARLNELGVEITLEEVEAEGTYMTGRPHFAKVLLRKGYVATYQGAFDKYLDESAKAYVQRLEPGVPEGIWRIRDGNGIPVLAHPFRLDIRDAAEEEKLIRWMCGQGLQGIEVYHTDHSSDRARRYKEIAERHSLLMTGGSDFHGDLKPRIRLGIGTGDLNVPREFLDRMRALVRS